VNRGGWTSARAVSSSDDEDLERYAPDPGIVRGYEALLVAIRDGRDRVSSADLLGVFGHKRDKKSS
jgi:hypothetical protein